MGETYLIPLFRERGTSPPARASAHSVPSEKSAEAPQLGAVCCVSRCFHCFWRRKPLDAVLWYLWLGGDGCRARVNEPGFSRIPPRLLKSHKGNNAFGSLPILPSESVNGASLSSLGRACRGLLGPLQRIDVEAPRQLMRRIFGLSPGSL